MLHNYEVITQHFFTFRVGSSMLIIVTDSVWKCFLLMGGRKKVHCPCFNNINRPKSRWCMKKAAEEGEKKRLWRVDSCASAFVKAEPQPSACAHVSIHKSACGSNDISLYSPPQRGRGCWSSTEQKLCEREGSCNEQTCRLTTISISVVTMRIR